MNRKQVAGVFRRLAPLIVIVSLLALAFPASAVLADEVVTFPDPNLEAAVREAISKPTGDIYQSDLDGLSSLDASSRSITDLTGLEHCTSLLSWLSLDSNQISDLSALTNLTGLRNLFLRGNQISDLSPLSGLTDLWGLYLFGNQISDLSPLSGLTSLRGVYLTRNQISDLSPLAGLTSLVSLYLEENQISDLSPLAGLTSLVSLHLDENLVSDLSPLSGLSNLDWLYVGDNQITDLSPLSGLTSHLLVLGAPDNQVTDLSPLSGFAELQSLNVGGNQISDLSPLSSLTNLEGLYLDHTQVGDLSPLAGLTSLYNLSLAGNQISDISALERLTGLDDLDLSSNQISDIEPLVFNAGFYGGLGDGDEVDLTDNPLSYNSLNFDVPMLQSQGVVVKFSGVPACTITSVSPNKAIWGQELSVTITGTNLDGATSVYFGDHVTVEGYSVDSPTQITALIRSDVPPVVPMGSPATKPVSVTTPDGIAAVADGFTLYGPYDMFVTAVSPATVFRGQRLNLTITGSGFTDIMGPHSPVHTGLVSIQFGQGITLNSYGASFNSISADITVAETATLGVHGFLLVGFINNASGQFVVSAEPTITAVSPAGLLQGQSGSVSITGTGFTGATVVSFGSDVAVDSFTVDALGQITATITISSSAAVGPRDVSVTNSYGTGIMTGGFRVYGPPTIVNLAPDHGGQGQTLSVVVTGTSLVEPLAVSFDSSGITVNSYTVNSATQITVSITIGSSAALGTRDVSVTTPGGTATLTGGFTVHPPPPPPTIVSIGPDHGGQGEIMSVTIIGTHLTGATAVSLGTDVTVNGYAVNSDCQITAEVSIDSPAATGVRDVQVTTPDGTATLAGGFTVGGWHEQYTTGDSAASGAYSGCWLSQSFTPLTSHTLNTVSFKLYKAGSPTYTVTIGLYAAGADDKPTGSALASTTFVASSLTTAVAWYEYQFPTGYAVTAGTKYALVMSATGGASGNMAYWRVSKAGTYAGGMKAISSNQGATWTTNSAQDFMFKEGEYGLFCPVPTITALTPASGVQGQTLSVTIAGTGLAGATAVTFGPDITVNSYAVDSATQITASITISGTADTTAIWDVTVMTPGGAATMFVGFTVEPAAPAITAVSPASGVQGQTLSVSVAGRYLTGATAVSFGPDITVNSYTVDGATQITASITISGTAAIGSRDVSVTMADGTATLAGAFTVNPPAANGWYEQYTAGASAASGVMGTSWLAQSFTPVTSHSLDAVSLQLYKAGSPTYVVTISLHATTGDVPTGSALASTTFQASSLTTTATWYDYEFSTGCAVTAGTKYALVLSATDGAAGNLVYWRVNTAGAYSRGMKATSAVQGTSWTTNSAQDFMFKEGQNPPVWYEQYTTGASAASGVMNASWLSQTFTPVTTHTFNAVSLQLYKAGSPTYTVTISLYATTGDVPTGSALTSTTFLASSLATTATWYDFQFSTAYEVTSGTKYAIVLSATDGAVGTLVYWRVNTAGTYSRGMKALSANQGTSWTTSSTADFMFKEGGSQ